MTYIINRRGEKIILFPNKVAQAVRQSLRYQYDKENREHEHSQEGNQIPR